MASVQPRYARHDATLKEFDRLAARPFWLETGQFREEACSDGLGWMGAHMMLGTAGPCSFGPLTVTHPTLSFVLEPGIKVATAVVSGLLLRPGRMNCTPDGFIGSGRLDREVRFITLTLRRSLLEDVGRELCGRLEYRLSLKHQYETPDRCIEVLVHSVVASMLRRDHVAAGYADSLIRTVVARLIYRHSNASRCFGGSDGAQSFAEPCSNYGLRVPELLRIRAYINARLEQRILVEDLASLCGRSAAQLSRLLKRSTGMSPHQYILNARIAEARRLLTGSELPIAEIALMSGFSSQEHLSRRFRETIGVPPGAFRRM